MSNEAIVSIPLKELDGLRAQVIELQQQLNGDVWVPLEVTMARTQGQGCLDAWIKYKRTDNQSLAKATGFTKQYIGALAKKLSLNDLKYSTVATLAKALGVRPAVLLDSDD